MAYVFENQNLGSTKATVSGSSSESGELVHSMSGINAKETSADSIMAGIGELYDIVGWTVTDLTRTVKQNVNDAD